MRGEDTQGSIAVVNRLAGIIAAELDPFNDRKPFSLVDFPDYSNVGDSAIWLGEIAYFNASHREPVYVCKKTEVNWDRLRRLTGQGTIYIHGGGNFGDLWPGHQAFRVELLRNCKGIPVVQLPQSIHFDKAENTAATRRAIEEHGNFTLFVRDKASQAFAQAAFDCEVKLCPDMAFYLGPQARVTKPKYRKLNLMRTDLERLNGPGWPPPSDSADAVTTDWLDEQRLIHPVAFIKAILRGCGAARIFHHTKLTLDYYNLVALNRHLRGLRLLSLGEEVVTDRLHAHILCTLLDIPHTIMDNNYGKISRFIEAWSTDWSGVTKNFA